MSTAILSIVKGVQKTPGDTNSAEQGLDEINLLDPFGFSLYTYEMKIPALKSSAIYADSPLTDGRTLIAGSLGNVTETIRVTLTAGTIVQMAAMLAKIGRFKQDCNDFWDTFGQIEPVYLKHQVVGEPGPRFALLYDIDIAIDAPLDPSEPTRDITIVVEREYGWRGLAPGANPKHWTSYINNRAVSPANSDIGTGLNLVEASAYNQLEWTNRTTVALPNYIDVPASMIPGDLPALAMVGLKKNENTAHVFVSRVTKPTSMTSRDSTPVTGYQHYDLSAAILTAASDLGTDTTLETDTGGMRYSVVSANYRRAKTTFATVATDTPRLFWSDIGGSSKPLIQTNLMRGRFMAFLRCRQDGGSSGDIKMHLRYGNTDVNNNNIETTEVTPTVQSGAGNTTEWPITYMGVINIPIADRAMMYNNGLGLGVEYTKAGAFIYLYARRTTGAGLLYVCDLMLVPFDEQSIHIASDVDFSNIAIVDTSGYFLRGEEKTAGGVSPSSTNGNLRNMQIMGQGITLLPNQNNRLYFFAYTLANTSRPADSFTAFVNIIPRWSGLRDT